MESFIDSGDHIVSKTYMTRVEGENTRLRHYLARLHRKRYAIQARGYAEVFSSIITSEVLGNTRIELNHPHLCNAHEIIALRQTGISGLRSMPLGLSPHDCLSNNLPGIPRRHYCGKHPPDDALFTSGTWNDPIVALFTSTSAVCVTGLGVVDTGTYFFFWDNFCCHPCSDWGLGYDSNTFLLLLLGAKFCLRDKVAIQQALDRTGMHDSAVNPLDHCHDTNFEITGVLLLLPVLCPIMDLTKDFG